jgi:hypothetical protein
LIFAFPQALVRDMTTLRMVFEKNQPGMMYLTTVYSDLFDFILLLQ